MKSTGPRTSADWVVSVGFLGALLFGLGALRGNYDTLTLAGGLVTAWSVVVVWVRSRRRDRADGDA